MSPHLDGVALADLARILEALRETQAEFPDLPAGPALRRAAAQHLSWDRRHRSCWDDPTFVSQYMLLRHLALDESTVYVATAIDRLATLLDAESTRLATTPEKGPRP